MSLAHTLDGESEGVTRRSVIQREEDAWAIELVGNRIGERHGSNSTEYDQSRGNLQAV